MIPPAIVTPSVIVSRPDMAHGCQGKRTGPTPWIACSLACVSSAWVAAAADAPVRDGGGNGPVSVAAFPGAAGVGEAVFRPGPGTHEFTGPFAG